MSGQISRGVVTNTAAGATPTLPTNDSAGIVRLTLTANATPVFPTPTAGQSFELELVQDATGSRTVTWPSTVRWAGGTAPTLTTTANKRDFFSFTSTDGATWVGRTVGLNYAA